MAAKELQSPPRGLESGIQQKKATLTGFSIFEEPIFQICLNNTHDLAFITDRCGRFLFSNERFIEKIGYSLEELRMKSFFEILSLESMGKLKNFFINSDPKERFLIKLSLISKIDDRFDVLVAGSTIDDPSCIIWNTKHLDDQTSSIVEIAARAAHDIRNQLTVPRLVLEQLLKTDFNNLGVMQRTQLYQQINNAFEEIHRSVQLTGDMILIARPKNSNIKEINVNRSIANVLMRIGNDQVIFNNDFSAEMPIVFMDQLMFDRAIYNLVVNSIQARATVISIKTKQTSDSVLIRIHDNGCGIAKKDIGRIFEPYVSTKEDQGTGLGLAIVKQAFESVGGEITVESFVNIETAFTIKLPIYK